MQVICESFERREPTPTREYTCISIGSVGFIRGERFLCFLSRLHFKGTEAGGDAPSISIRALSVGTLESNRLWGLGYVGAHTVQQIDIDIGPTVTTALCILFLTPFSVVSKCPLSPRKLPDNSFELTEIVARIRREALNTQ